MRNYFVAATCIISVSIFSPASTRAAPVLFSAAQSVVADSSAPGNAYAAGASVVLTAPVAGDFIAGGGSLVTAAPVSGDALLLGGSVDSRAPVEGDLRVVGGNVEIDRPVAGDLLAIGYAVRTSGHVVGNMFIVAANAIVQNGASGPVTIYANNVVLGGEFTGDVQVVAGGKVTLAPNTHINGTLSYDAPEEATVADTAVVDGDVVYTNVSYLPSVGAFHTLAFLSLGFFLVARVVGALILAGLLAGLFPRCAELIVARVSEARPRDIFLTLLLGFAVVVATPVIIILFALTFIGVGLAILLGLVYALALLLAFFYAGIAIGGVVARRFAVRDRIVWHDGVLGMAAFSIISLIPYIGSWLAVLAWLFALGALLRVFFSFTFPGEPRNA